MTTKTRTIKTKTPEERQAEADALHHTLVDQVAGLVDSDGWRRFLVATAAFHAYSLPDVLLILGQCPHATRVAGDWQWQARGRQVRQGERAIRIRGYSTKKFTTEDPSGQGPTRAGSWTCVASTPCTSTTSCPPRPPAAGELAAQQPVDQQQVQR